MTVQIAYLLEEQTGGPTGVRVVEPTADAHQVQRGNFYAVVDLSGAPGAIASLGERLLSAMQRTYYNARGTQSQVLMEALRQAHQLLQAEYTPSNQTWHVGIVCVGLMADRLALAGLGDAFAFVTTDGGAINICPPDRLAATETAASDPLALWPMHRQKIDLGGAILLAAGRWLDQVSPRTLAGATAYVDLDSCQEAAEGLRAQVNHAAWPGLLIVFEGGGASSQPPPPGGGRSPKPRLGGLPTALNATPPVTSAPPAGSKPESDSPHTPKDASSGVPAGGGEQAPATNAQSPPNYAVSATLAAGAKVGLDMARELIGTMLPERAAPSAGVGTSFGSRDATVMASTAPAAVGISATERMQLPPAPAVRREAYVPPPRATGSRARLIVTVAVIVLLLVPAVVAAMYWQQGATNRAEAESLLDLAEARVLSAQDALDQEDSATARSLLTEGRSYVIQAEEILGRTARSSDLLAQIESEERDVLQIIPLYGLTVPLATFPPDAEPQQMLVIAQDLYVLDSGLGEVLQYRIDPDGETLVEADSSAEGQVVLREGDNIDGTTVGQLVDMAWQTPIPGFEDKSNLLVLDSNNRIFRYNQVDGSALVDFGAPGNWNKVTQTEVFLDRLYVVDEGINQIYRYAPGQYTQPPAPWFQPTTGVNLQDTKAMRIDGDIWLLFKDGKVVRYHAGEQVPFGLDDSVALPSDPVDMYVSRSGDNTLYLADAAEERILLFDMVKGSYLGQFQAADGRPLRGLRGIFVDEGRNVLFVLTDEALYQQRLPR